MAPISKTLATNIHHLISYLLPDHAGSRPLTSASTQKVVGELADLVAPIVGSTLNGVQVDLEWEHYQPVVVCGLAVDVQPEPVDEPGQVEPEPALGKKVRLDKLVDRIEDETPLYVIHPDWNDGRPVRLREVSLWGDDIPFGDIGVRYSYVDDDGHDRLRGAYVSAATLVAPCGASPA